MLNIVLEIQKCVSVLFTGTTCARQVHREATGMSWPGSRRNTLSHTGANWRRTMAGLWPGAKERNVSDDSVANEESGTPRGHTVLEVCRWAHILYAEHIEFAWVARQSSLLDSHDADAVGLHQL